jgi:peptidoglycan/LPS O-acetylase OafA/YrhL
MGRANYFDQFRLVFAALVLLSHSFELIDGNRSREPLSVMFGTASFGEFAVCGFFILSGFLIAKSWARAKGLAPYLTNRILRIVPAFLVAFVLSVFVAGVLGAADARTYFAEMDWLRLGLNLVTLDQPTTAPTFVGSHDPQVNGAMWTIQYEFACYLLAPLALWRRSVLVVFWLLAASVTIATTSEAARFLLMFYSGAAFFTFGLRPRRLALIASAAALPVLMLLTNGWEIGLATAGAYLLLSAGFVSSKLKLPDPSYGLYLYGSPVLKLLILWGVTSPLRLFTIALPCALMLGLASWYGVERIALTLKERRLPLEVDFDAPKGEARRAG